MSLEQYSPEELKEVSMIELAFAILEEKKQASSFQEIVEEVSEKLALTKTELAARIAQFYTDLNIDGRFICLGENRWGLRSWYPYEQIDEEILPQPKAKPKKKRKTEEDHDDHVVEDDFDDVDDIDDVEEDDFVEEDADDEEFEDDDLLDDDSEDEDLDDEDLEEVEVFVEDDVDLEEDDEDLDEEDDKEDKL